MANAAQTFESVNKRVEAADLSLHKPGGKKHFTAKAVAAGPLDVIGRICPIWGVVKPILALVSAPLPKKWKDAIKVFSTLMDTLCSGAGG